METAIYQAYVRILTRELRPATGCTEPIAIAYAAAMARNTLGAVPDEIQAHCSGNIIKNVYGVTVPNSGGGRGVEIAAALGAVAGNADRELEVLALMAQGQSNSQIAESLFVSGAAVGKHVANIFAKMGLTPDQENRRVRAILTYLQDKAPR